MAATTTVGSNFTIIGSHTDSPKFFWKGVELTEVKQATVKTDSEGGMVRLKVQKTDNFDSQYAEMDAAGIVVKKQ